MKEFESKTENSSNKRLKQRKPRARKTRTLYKQTKKTKIHNKTEKKERAHTKTTKKKKNKLTV